MTESHVRKPPARLPPRAGRPPRALSPTETYGGTFRIGRYRVVEEIGAGGMASVHLARADGPGGFQKWVALKRIHRHLCEEPAFVDMFLDEARVAARISHPNVAQVFELGRSGATFWIAMEYLHGEPLRELVRARSEHWRPAMSAPLAAKLVADAAEGLHAAHELRGNDGELLNLVHRDVSPQNIFVTYDGAVKVVDFGIAKGEGRLTCTRAGTLKGKLGYMSPEQAQGLSVDRRTDVFALGVVLWELVTGRRLFHGNSEIETLEQVQQCAVPLPSGLLSGFPLELEAIMMRALSRRRELRFATARELSRALSRHLTYSGACVGYEEIGAHVRRVLPGRFRAREALLRWAGNLEPGSGPPPLSRRSVAPTVPGRRSAEQAPVPAWEDVDDMPTRILPRTRANPPPRARSQASVLLRLSAARARHEVARPGAAGRRAAGSGLPEPRPNPLVLASDSAPTRAAASPMGEPPAGQPAAPRRSVPAPGRSRRVRTRARPLGVMAAATAAVAATLLLLATL